jgi:hypothetical protein
MMTHWMPIAICVAFPVCLKLLLGAEVQVKKSGLCVVQSVRRCSSFDVLMMKIGIPMIKLMIARVKC